MTDQAESPAGGVPGPRGEGAGVAGRRSTSSGARWSRATRSVEAMERRGVSRTALADKADYSPRCSSSMTRGIDPDKARAGRWRSRRRSTPPCRRNLAGKHAGEIAALIAQGRRGVAATHARGRAPKDGHKWPPIINLSEAGGYYFATGSAELTAGFRSRAADRGGRQAAGDRRVPDVDVIEVIGHTDERRSTAALSNLDRELPAVTSGDNGVGVLQSADNAGLGLARALAVVERLVGRTCGCKQLPHPAALRRPADRHRRHGSRAGTSRATSASAAGSRSGCASRCEVRADAAAMTAGKSNSPNQFSRCGRSSSSPRSGVSATGPAWWWIIRHWPSMRRNQFEAANIIGPITSRHSTRPSSPSTIAVAS